MIRPLLGFAAGALFAAGLAISGMTQPSKVIGFLDLFGDWDPALALVMGGAVGVHLLSYRLIMRRSSPLLSTHFDLPVLKALDGRLLAGTAVFGIGWGLAGYCPGPALVSLGSGRTAPLLVAAGMIAGVALFEAIAKGAFGRRPLPSLD